MSVSSTALKRQSNGSGLALQMHCLMNNTSYSNIIDNFNENKKYAILFKQHLHDQNVQTWQDIIENISKLDLFNHIRMVLEIILM